ncbi:MAG: bacterial transcriptional activator domain-containing protein, partial [Syntrophobacteria bacterium]
TAALRQFDRCKEALQIELGVNPSRLTMKLYKQICMDPITTPRPATLDAMTGAKSDDSLAGMLLQLKELNRTLAEIQNQVDHQIRKIEVFLKKPE